MVDGVEGPGVILSVGAVGFLDVPAGVGLLLWGRRGGGDVCCSGGDPLLNWYQDLVTTLVYWRLSSVCSVHGAVVDAEVEEAAVEVEVVVGGGGDEVVTAEVVLINGW